MPKAINRSSLILYENIGKSVKGFFSFEFQIDENLDKPVVSKLVLGGSVCAGNYWSHCGGGHVCQGGLVPGLFHV